MRVALCLHGVVGNLYTNKQDLSWSEDVDYRIGLEHYRRHLFSVNSSVDVFIHSWSLAFAERITRDYGPRRKIFETQIDFKQDSQRMNFLKSRWYSTRAVVDLKKQHEHEHGFTYDWVMLSRFDLALLRDLDFAKYDGNTFYAARHGPDGTQTNDGWCDLFFYANSPNIDRFASLYDVWEEYGIFDAHEESYVHAQRLGMTAGHDLLRGNDFELVRGIYENCQYAGEEFPGINSLTKAETYRADRFLSADQPSRATFEA
ncbi:MAG TPA: hypothetical protein VE961_06810 [Pyrinomonadaceae bacterium]|nr:hypothetical protein [Pyrinomonadaceae bacterium]